MIRAVLRPSILRFAAGAALLAGSAASSACSSPDADFSQPVQNSNSGLSCTMDGTWATVVQVGVEWKSLTIQAGAGIVRQWILSHRQLVPNYGGHDAARSCGIGARSVPLGSPWFSTIPIPLPGGITSPSEWTGVTFDSQLFDSGRMPEVPLEVVLQGGDPSRLGLGNSIRTSNAPFSHGVDLAPDAEWPERHDMATLMQNQQQDPDVDGFPGITGHPFQGTVPGASPPAAFQDPRLDLTENTKRTNGLFMAIRNRAVLDGTLTSCDPPRFDGTVLDESLLIETRNVGCIVAGDNVPCDDNQAGFIDANLPQFKANGTSKIVSIKVPDGTTCSDVRAIDFGLKE